MELQKWIDKGYEILLEYTPKILLALAIWIIGAFIIKYLRKGISKSMDKANYDPSLKKFLLNLISCFVVKSTLNESRVSLPSNTKFANSSSIKLTSKLAL